PILCVAAALAEGETTITGAGELRVKESDRIAALEQLRLLGVAVSATADGLVIRGTGGRRLHGGRVESHGDHRTAMAFGVGGLAAERGIDPDDAAALARLVAALDFELADDGERLLVGGRDLSAAIRRPAAGELASRVSTQPAVRQRLVALQRALGAAGGI